MTKHDIDWYMGLATELETDFTERNNMFEKIDQMVRPEWNLPDDFTAVITDVMAIVDTAPSDAINSGAIALSSRDPVFSVSPFAPDPMEYDRAQTLEDSLHWHFHRDNRRGNGTVMFDIADSSLRYNTICIRTDDLAYILPKNHSLWTPLQRRAWAQGRFIHKVINPRNVYYIISSFGLSTVVHVESMRLKDVIAHWSLYEDSKTDEGKRVSQTLKDLREKSDELTANGTGNPSQYFTQSYCLDDDKLMIWGRITDSNGEDLVQQQAADYVFADQENKYGFIPWSIRVAGSRLESAHEYMVNPLLAPLYWSRSWDKINLAKSIIYSEPIRRAKEPRHVSQTMNGEGVTVDHENGADVNVKPNEDYKNLQPLQMDAAAMAIVSALEAAMNRTTGASMIGDTTKISSNTPFATFSAMVKVALSRLDKQNQSMGDACADMACNMMWWVDKTNVPLSSYAQSDKQYKSGTMVPRGAEVTVTKEDFDLNALGLTAKVKATTPTDAMEQLNMAVIMSTKMNWPVSQLLEDMGYENVGLAYELWAREFQKNAELQAKAAQIMAEAQGEAQVKTAQAMQSVQAQAQQSQLPQGQGTQSGVAGAGQGISNTSFGGLGGGAGFNPAMGGGSATQGAPTMTRENITQRNYFQNNGGQ